MEIISVAKKYSLDVYRYASRALVELFPASTIRVIVPDHQVQDFERSLRPGVIVESELNYDSGFFPALTSACAKVNPSRKGWYLQQFIKMEALRRLSLSKERIVIWDADAVPLKKIEFFDDSGRPKLFTSAEGVTDNRGNYFSVIHQPYFRAIEALLGITRTWDFSCIAQTMPMSSELAGEFFDYVESKSGEKWWQAVINSVDFSENSGFSEYETLGAFMLNKHPHSICFQTDGWDLNGWRTHGSPRKAWKSSQKSEVSNNLALVGFEVWQKPPSRARGLRKALSSR